MEMGSNFDAIKLLQTNLYQTKKKEKRNRKGKQGNQFQTNTKDIIISLMEFHQRCSELQYLGVSTLRFEV